MSRAVRRSKEQRQLFWEIVVCLGPTLLFLPTGVLLVPHQLRLIIYDGRVSSLWVVFYYLGIAALVVAVRAMYVFVRDGGRRIVPALAAQVFLACGILALAIGPFGGFVLGGSLPVYSLLIFVIMPLACVAHLAAQSKEYVLPIARSENT